MSEDKPKLADHMTFRLSQITAARVRAVASQLGWAEGKVVRQLVEDGLGELERRALAAYNAMKA